MIQTNNKSENLIDFSAGSYKKAFKESWEYLYYKTTDTEYKVAGYMAMKAAMYSNSLKPLCDDLSLREYANIFNIGKDRVKKVLENLYNLGVYGKFEVCEECDQVVKATKYWVLNPYLSMENVKVNKDLLTLFENTQIAKAVKLTLKKNKVMSIE